MAGFPRLLTIALAVLVAGLAAVLVWIAVGSDASDDDPPGRTLRFSERSEALLITTSTGAESATSQGDVVAFTTPLHAPAGERVGRLYWTCITTVGARTFERSTNTCNGAFGLRDGTLTFQFNLTPTAHRTGTITGAITGGTGAYANARGVVLSESTETGRDDTISLVE